MKTIRTICLDTELVAEARVRKMNLSALFNETLREVLDLKKKEPEGSSIKEQVIALKASLATAEAELEKEKNKKAKAMGIKKKVIINAPD